VVENMDLHIMPKLALLLVLAPLPPPLLVPDQRPLKLSCEDGSCNRLADVADGDLHSSDGAGRRSSNV
jgi:hypothetical protein